MIFAPAGIGTSGATSIIRSPSMRMIWFSSIFPARASKSRPARTAVKEGGTYFGGAGGIQVSGSCVLFRVAFSRRVRSKVPEPTKLINRLQPSKRFLDGLDLRVEMLGDISQCF